MAMDHDSSPYASFKGMPTSRDTPNPLRPYYVPPSIGPEPNASASHSNTTYTYSTHTTSSSTHPRASFAAPPASKPSFGTSARDILSDYGDYLPDQSQPFELAGMAKKLMDQAIWNYTSVLLAQPFEVAKTVLQVHLAAQQQLDAALQTPRGGARSRQSSYKGSSRRYADEYSSEDEDSDNDSPSYFTSAAPASTSYSSRSPSSRRRQTPPSRSHSLTPTPSSSSRHRQDASTTHKLELRRPDSLFEVLGQLWQREGAWGVWKGTNSTFVYNVLSRTIESWTRSLLSALLNLPDPGLSGNSAVGGLDIVESPNPLLSLFVAVGAAGIAGVVLAPLDLVRTRLLLTSQSSPPRALIPSLRSLPSLIAHPELLLPTILHSSIPTAISASTPIVVRSTLRIDPILTPAAYGICSFLSSTVELFVKLPLETVLRRGQVHVLQEQATDRSVQRRRDPYSNFPGTKEADAEVRTVVEPGPWKGVWGTMWFIVREEGLTQTAVVAARPGTGLQGRKVRKGQGVRGLWRGWRVGFWGLVGVWGAAALGGAGGAGGEF
ncbi:mitochondrial carrier [Aulographum hederae CBS 113979]|uniref:Mitochondrial carrier n=1 Tax=Aulographum hederae CBS 113979 TaxID=1176131 RepID=A0A6G1HD38_9PEZI|nr:mitochondrial carrier [Aulographum hederae CBS 113979]